MGRLGHHDQIALVSASPIALSVDHDRRAMQTVDYTEGNGRDREGSTVILARFPRVGKSPQAVPGAHDQTAGIGAGGIEHLGCAVRSNSFPRLSPLRHNDTGITHDQAWNHL